MRLLRAHFDLLRAVGTPLLVVVVLGTVALVFHSEQDSTNRAFQLSLVESCQRLQILRSQDNAGRLAEFGIYQTVLALPNLGELHTRLQTSLELLTWTPRTDCKRAVNTRGVRYRSPLPVLFTDRLPPPAALSP